MPPDGWATYDIKEQVAKWLHEEALPRPGVGTHVGVINAWGEFVMVSLEAAQPSALTTTEGSSPIDVTWYRFGLRELDVVPAWRQSMFAAALMIESNPSAALVLIAAGFEAFFLETMRINWKERGLRMSSFGRLRKQSISNLIDWLPGAVGLRSLSDSSDDLESQWRKLVNERRNDVVHRANVHFTSDQVRESLDCAIRCISFIDELGIFRPHTYFAGT